MKGSSGSRVPWSRFLRLCSGGLLALLCLCLPGAARAADGGGDDTSAGKLVIDIGWDSSKQEVVVRRRCAYTLAARSEALAALRETGSAFCSGYTVLRDGGKPATDDWEPPTDKVTQGSPRDPAHVETESTYSLARRSGPDALEVAIDLPTVLVRYPEGLPKLWTVEVRAPRWRFNDLRGPVESQTSDAVSWRVATAARDRAAESPSVVLRRTLETTMLPSVRRQTRIELVAAFGVAVVGIGAVTALLVARLAGPAAPRRWRAATMAGAVATFFFASVSTPPMPWPSWMHLGVFTLSDTGAPTPDEIWTPSPALGLWLWYVLPVAGWWFSRRLATLRPPSPRILVVSCASPLLLLLLMTGDQSAGPGIWYALLGTGVCALGLTLVLRRTAGGARRRWAATAGALLWIVAVTYWLSRLSIGTFGYTETGADAAVGLLCAWPIAAWLTSLLGPVARRTLGKTDRAICFLAFWVLVTIPFLAAYGPEPPGDEWYLWSYYKVSFFTGYLGSPLCAVAVCGVVLQLLYLLRRGAVGDGGRAVEPVGRVLLVCAVLMALGNPSLRTLSMWGDALAVLWVALGSLALLPVGSDITAAKFRRVGRRAHARFMGRWVRAQLVWDARADYQRAARSALAEDHTLTPSDFSARWDALEVPGRCGDPATRLARAKRFALGSSAGVAPRTAGLAGALLAQSLALPWAVYKLGTADAVGVDPFMPFHLTEISKVLRFAHWALYGFVFGYYYALLRGNTPIGKAAALAAVVLPAEVLAMSVLTVDPQYTRYPSWADMAVACGGLAGQTFVVCMGLGLGWEWWLARAAAMKWSQVRNFRRLSSVSVPLTTVLVAAATAFATVVAGTWAQQELQPPSGRPSSTAPDSPTEPAP
ncbi:hypothetical protein ABT300_01010 [Streptomyces sp. NPDC001027]|uniref:hypothetical protein n=1 Tax=Streptomyces sp. NPDC001027 TaxID=3154771 RepID=UPI0033316B82